MNKGEINEILKKIENNELSDSEGMKQLEALRERFENDSQKEESKAESVYEESRKSDNLNFHFNHNENLLKDHLIFGEQVLMGVSHLSMVIEHIRKNYSYKNCLIKNALFSSALILKEREIGTIKIQETDRSETIINIESLSQKDKNSDYEKNASFQFQQKENNAQFNTLDVYSLEHNALKVIEPSIFYKHLDQACYGSSLFSVEKVYEISDGVVLGRIKLTPEMRKEQDKYYLLPALFDACHVTSTLALKGDPVKNHWVPLLIKEIYVDLTLESKKFVDSYCYIKHKISNTQISEFDMQVCDPNGKVFLVLNGFTTKYVPSKEALFGKPQPVKTVSSQPMFRPVIGVFVTEDNLKSVIQEFIQSIFASLLNLDKNQVPLDKNFMEIGLDSNSMIEAVKSIEVIGVELYATLFFEYQNIDQLVEYLNEEYGEKFAVYFGKSVASSTNSPNNSSVKKEDSLRSSNEHLISEKPSKTRSTLKKSFQQKVEGHQDIAIIGMHGYLPQSQNLDEFWQHIAASDDLVTEIPLSHWDYRPWFDKNPENPNKTYSKWGGFIDNVDKFDPTFFEISPKFAEWMDPQLRLLLQSAYKTLEDAGIVNQIRGSNTSVFVGSCFHEYWDEIVRAQTPIVDYQYWSQVMSSLSGTVSYTFDLQGASVPLDNACASSLSALHLGIQSILSGESDLSLVAGLNIILSPLHYVHFSKLHALSPNGRCYTFDEKADGYVPGEGVVSVLIKRLDKAIQDGDNIHAVIKGTAINHTGRSNNSTSPRPELQTKMLIAAWEKAQINPEDISYIDAHGTGTKLGDPIEVNALKRAFKKYTEKTHFCTLGSTKAHMGHLEGAAGLSSVIKVVLMMKNKKIPQMPYFEKQSPLIQLDNSPFIINTELVDWKSKDGKKLLAGVSSFGITGNNAHAVIEEYIPEEIQSSGVVNSSSPIMIPLSARKQDRLKEHAENLLKFIQKNSEMNLLGAFQSPQINLIDLAYTLQVGREEMKERLGMIVHSIKELEEKLQSFLDGKRNVSNLFLGQAKENQEIISIFMGDEDHQKTIEAWILKGKYNKLMNLWAKGFSFDWNKLYGENKPQRISVPTYPFAKDRYWVENLGSPPIDFVKSRIKNHLHPLLQENTSVLSEQRFSSTFTGDEFFLRDHIIQGEKVLPGVTYLEMAYEAVVRAKKNPGQDIRNNIQLKNVVWAKPIVVDTPQEVHIRLYTQGMEEVSSPIINYEIYTENPNLTDERIIHCQGMAILTPSEIFQTLNLASVREKFNQNSISSQECNTLFESMGFKFGPAHKGIVEIYVRDNEEANPEVFAKINLPSCVLDTQNQFTLHPSILDASLQALIAGINIRGRHTQPMLPFVLERIEIIDKCPILVWVWARLVQSGSDRVQKFDVDLYDESGKICVKMQGFTSRVLKKDISVAQFSKKDETNGILVVKPVLHEKLNGKHLSDSDETKKDYLFEKIQKILTKLASKLLKLGVEDIDINEELSTFGFDSIILTSYGNQINRTYKLELTPTVFFDYPTIASLAKYLADEHAAAFTEQSFKPVLHEKSEEKSLSDETKKDYLFEKIQKILTELSSKLLKLGVEDIDINEELSTFGFDSIILTSYGNQINRTYKLELTPTVFFEYPTIASLAKYLADEHAAAFTEQAFAQNKELSTTPHAPKENQEQREDYQFSTIKNNTVLNQYNGLEDHKIKSVVFMFSGQGSHYYHMGKDLYQKDPIFKKWLDEANDVASPILGKSIIDIMYDESKKMTDPFVQTQEACSAIVIQGYAMAKFLIEKGIKPDYLLGSSLGEITACIIGGGVELHDALLGLSKQLSLIEKKCKKGKMIGILSSPELYQKRRLLNECSELAAINSKSHFVVSCHERHTTQIENELRTQNVDFQTLPVANAYHCSLLDPVEMVFNEIAADMPFRSPSIPVVSCAHAEVINSLNVSYLWDIYRQPIRFQDTVQMLVKQQGCIFLDVGPSGTLSNFVKSNLAKDSKSESFPILTSFRNDVANFDKIQHYFESSNEDHICVSPTNVGNSAVIQAD